jgi:hypothetical protein
LAVYTHNDELRLTIADFADEDVAYIAMNVPDAIFPANGIKSLDIGLNLIVAAMARLPWTKKQLKRRIEDAIGYARWNELADEGWTPAEIAFILDEEV